MMRLGKRLRWLPNFALPVSAEVILNSQQNVLVLLTIVCTISVEWQPRAKWFKPYTRRQRLGQDNDFPLGAARCGATHRRNLLRAARRQSPSRLRDASGGSNDPNRAVGQEFVQKDWDTQSPPSSSFRLGQIPCSGRVEHVRQVR